MPIAQTSKPTINGLSPSENSFVPINFNPNSKIKVPIISLNKFDHFDGFDGEVAKTPRIISLFVPSQSGR